MEISPNEASKPGVWAFLACLVVPDLVRRRYPGTDGTSTERFLGMNRGMRNAMGRLWWRAFVLHGEGDDPPYLLLEQLGEDELVQIMERPTISGHPPLARSLAGATLNQRYHGYPGGRASLLRDAVKRVRRTAAVVPLEVLPPPVLDRQVTKLVDEAYQAAGTRVNDAELGPWASDTSYAAFAETHVKQPEAPLAPVPVASEPPLRTIGPGSCSASH